MGRRVALHSTGSGLVVIRFILGAVAGAAAVYLYAIFLSYTRDTYTSGGVSIYVPALPPDTTRTIGTETIVVH